MKEGYGKKAAIGCGLGFILAVIGKTFATPSVWFKMKYLEGNHLTDSSLENFFIFLYKTPEIGRILYLVGIVLWFFGCYMIAVGKGRHGARAIIGIFPLIGLIVLLCLRDESKIRGRQQ